MLIGQYSSKISKKRRVAVPFKFRQQLGEVFILTRWYENCLALVSISEWNLLVKKLIGEAKGITEPVRDTDRFLLGLAFELKPDEQGRVIIPEKLAEFAGIKEGVVFIGLGNRVEVWDEENWVKKEDEVQKHASEYIEKITKQTRKVGD